MTGIDSPTDALRVAALPDQAQSVDFNDIFSLAMGVYDDTAEGRQELAEDIETFTLYAMQNYDNNHSISHDPIVESPSLLMAYTALGSRIIEEFSRVRDTPNKYIQATDYVREEFARHIGNLVFGHNATGSVEVLHQVAEHHYSSSSSKKEGHPGQVIKDIEYTGENDRAYLSMPMVFASTDALVYETDESYPARFDLKGDDNDPSLASFVHNNHLYIPVDHLTHTNFDYLTDAIETFVDWIRGQIKDEDIYHLADKASGIHNNLEDHWTSGRRGRVIKGESRKKTLIQTIRRALHDMDGLRISDYHKSSAILNALHSYNGNKYEEAVISDFDSNQSLSNVLLKFANEEGPPRIGVEFDSTEGVKKYKVGDLYSGAEHLHVDDIEDLFDLPCFGNLDERLKEKGPVRWELFSLVRMVWWLPDYHDKDTETIVTALKDVFDRWPWYDPKETEYQVRYELTGTDNLGLASSEQEVLPLNCNNERWKSNYCIGREECPYYTMYSAIDFHDDLDLQLDQMNQDNSI